MNRCLLTYESTESGGEYSTQGLKRIEPRLRNLQPLELSAEQLRREAVARADKMSIQGVQPKLSAALDVPGGRFEIVDIGGTYILKPQTLDYRLVPENEDLTMKLAAAAGIPVPPHGLIRSGDGSLTYFIERFDRRGRSKIPVEDFGQLTGATRDTKYSSSMERAAGVVEEFCTFPKVEHAKLLRLTLFSFLVGNEDMHLKNLSLVTRERTIELTPAYDLLNSTIILAKPREELALPVRGKKSKLAREDFLDYFAKDRLGLNQRVIDDVIGSLRRAQTEWERLIGASFLSDELKARFRDLVASRSARLFA